MHAENDIRTTCGEKYKTKLLKFRNVKFRVSDAEIRGDGYQVALVAQRDLHAVLIMSFVFSVLPAFTLTFLGLLRTVYLTQMGVV